LPTYDELKLKKKLKYIIYGMSKDLKEVEVYKTSESGDYDEFLKDLPEVIYVSRTHIGEPCV
jgi:cofilin